MCCFGGGGYSNDSIFEEALDITGARDWEMANHTVPAPTPRIPSKLASVMAGFRDLPDEAFGFMDGFYFPD